VDIKFLACLPNSESLCWSRESCCSVVNTSGKKFKHKQIQNLLLEMANEPMEIQKQKLNDVFDNWKGNLEQVDDVCLIGIRV